MSNPVFRRLTNGELILDYTEAARRVKLSRGRVRMNTVEKKSLTAEEVKKHANIQAAQKRGGSTNDSTEVLSEYEIQFGVFHGQTFKWVIESALGYTGWLVDSMRNETVTASALSQNKAAFKAYAQLFRECREVIAKKREQRLNKAKEQQTSSKTTPSATPATGVTTAGRFRSSTATVVAPLLHRNTSPHRISAAVSRTLANSKRSSIPNIPASTRTPTASTQVPAVDDIIHTATSRSPSHCPEVMFYCR